MGNTAYNGRFDTMAAVTPQTILWEFARYTKMIYISFQNWSKKIYL